MILEERKRRRTIIIVWTLAFLGVIASGAQQFLAYKENNALQSKFDSQQSKLDSQFNRVFQGVENKPDKKAALTFSFGHNITKAIRSISLPVKDNIVHVDYSIWNETETTATSVVIQLQICDGCKFTEDMIGYNALGVNPEKERGFQLDRIYAKSNLEHYSADIEVPKDISSMHFGIHYSCDNCLVSDKEGHRNIGIIKLLR